MTMLQQWLADTTRIHRVGDVEIGRVRKRIECPDGFAVSVQASRTHYCSPRVDDARWYEVELGYPSERVDSWAEYAEDKDDPTDTVYAYVPISIVEDELARRGWKYHEAPDETK